MNKILQASNISKKFGEFVAVDDISISIAEKEIVALLGPNGAGKTTTIRCLTSLSRPNGIKKSNISVNSVNMIEKPQSARKLIGVCAQDINLYLDSTGEENMELQAYFYRIPKKIAKLRIAQLLDLVKLTDRKDELVKNYSGGMKRRLQIARSLVARPKLFFLDEPTLGLSPQARTEIWKYILQLRDQNMAILFTTHYMEEVDYLADRVLIMNKGKIITEGSPDELKDKFLGGSYVLIKTLEKDQVCELLENKGFSVKLFENEILVKSINGRFPELFKSIEGCNIDELSMKKPSLQDVFLEITGSHLIETKMEGGII